jgi:hypothetical protein
MSEFYSRNTCALNDDELAMIKEAHELEKRIALLQAHLSLHHHVIAAREGTTLLAVKRQRLKSMTEYYACLIAEIRHFTKA